MGPAVVSEIFSVVSCRRFEHKSPKLPKVSSGEQERRGGGGREGEREEREGRPPWTPMEIELMMTSAIKHFWKVSS